METAAGNIASLTSSRGNVANPDLALNNSIEIKSVAGVKRNLLVIVVVVLAFAILGIGFYLFMNFKNKKQVSSIVTNADIKSDKNSNTSGGVISKEQKTVNLDELNNYIETALTQGHNEQNIRNDLIKSGWAVNDINSGFNYVKLKIFVKDKLNQGFDKEKITISLKAKGWKDDLINSVFKGLKL